MKTLYKFNLVDKTGMIKEQKNAVSIYAAAKYFKTHWMTKGLTVTYSGYTSNHAEVELTKTEYTYRTN